MGIPLQRFDMSEYMERHSDLAVSSARLRATSDSIRVGF